MTPNARTAGLDVRTPAYPALLTVAVLAVAVLIPADRGTLVLERVLAHGWSWPGTWAYLAWLTAGVAAAVAAGSCYDTLTPDALTRRRVWRTTRIDLAAVRTVHIVRASYGRGPRLETEHAILVDEDGHVVATCDTFTEQWAKLEARPVLRAAGITVTTTADTIAITDLPRAYPGHFTDVARRTTRGRVLAVTGLGLALTIMSAVVAMSWT